MTFLNFSTVIPDGEKALVTYPNGTRREVEGPAKIINWPGTDVAPYEREILKDHEGATVYDDAGRATIYEGPRVVHVSPLGAIDRHRTYPLQPQEAMVVVDVDGKPTIYVGTGYSGEEGTQNGIELKRVAQVVVKSRETVHTFRWTGSKGDTEYKAPGALTIQKLRLQQTQTWFAVDTRTKDGVMIRLNLMLFIAFNDIRRLLRNDDPLGVLFNLVTAAILKVMGETKFDDFRKAPDRIVAPPASLGGDEHKNARDKLAELGVGIDNAILRQWAPTDATVERLMAQEASTTAQQAVAEAQHIARMKEITNERKELVERAKNQDARDALAKGEGNVEAEKVKAFVNGLRSDKLFNGDEASLTQLVLLKTTADSAKGGLTLTQEAFLPHKGKSMNGKAAH